MRNSGNLLLASLSASDIAVLEPHLTSIYLEHAKVLFEAGGEVTDIYFPTGAIISLVAGLSSGETVEAAMEYCDELLIKSGWKFITTEQAEKLKVLL